MNGLHPPAGSRWVKRSPLPPCHPTVAGVRQTPEFPWPREFPTARCSGQQSPTAGLRARSGCQRLGMRRVALTFCRPQTIILHLAKIQTRLVTLLAWEGSGASREEGLCTV